MFPSILMILTPAILRIQASITSSGVMAHTNVFYTPQGRLRGQCGAEPNLKGKTVVQLFA
jgi:hypothetical protein